MAADEIIGGACLTAYCLIICSVYVRSVNGFQFMF